MQVGGIWAHAGAMAISKQFRRPLFKEIWARVVSGAVSNIDFWLLFRRKTGGVPQLRFYMYMYCSFGTSLGWVEVAHLEGYLLLGINRYEHAVFFNAINGFKVYSEKKLKTACL